jgi:hypothetical protein
METRRTDCSGNWQLKTTNPRRDDDKEEEEQERYEFEKHLPVLTCQMTQWNIQINDEITFLGYERVGCTHPCILYTQI